MAARQVRETPRPWPWGGGNPEEPPEAAGSPAGGWLGASIENVQRGHCALSTQRSFVVDPILLAQDAVGLQQSCEKERFTPRGTGPLFYRTRNFSARQEAPSTGHTCTDNLETEYWWPVGSRAVGGGVVSGRMQRRQRV